MFIIVPLQAATPFKHGQWINWLIILACFVISIIGFNNQSFLNQWAGVGFRAIEDNPDESGKANESRPADKKKIENPDSAANMHVESFLKTDKYPRPVLALTSSFLHGGWMHLIGNMLMLWVFGNAMNTKLGPILFPILYGASALGSGLLHYHMSDNMPVIGASGAIYGVMGAFLVIFTHKQVRSLFMIMLRFRLFMIPGSVIIVFWVLWDLLMIHLENYSGVALWGHLGGFATGFLFAILAVLTRLTRRDPDIMVSSTFGS